MDEWGVGRARRLLRVGYVISALVEAGALGMDAKGLAPSIPWSLVALVAFLAFAVLVLMRIIGLENALDARSPNVELVQVYVLEGVMSSKKPLILSAKGEQLTKRPTNYAIARFANNPRRPTELNHANNVRAICTFVDEGGRLIHGQVNGRWTDSPAPESKERIRELTGRKLTSDGSDEDLVFVSQIAENGHWYIFNNDNYFMDAMVSDERRLPDERIRVNICLVGERIKKDFWIQLSKDDKGNMQIVEERRWLKRRANPRRLARRTRKA